MHSPSHCPPLWLSHTCCEELTWIWFFWACYLLCWMTPASSIGRCSKKTNKQTKLKQNEKPHPIPTFPSHSFHYCIGLCCLSLKHLSPLSQPSLTFLILQKVMIFSGSSYWKFCFPVSFLCLYLSMEDLSVGFQRLQLRLLHVLSIVPLGIKFSLLWKTHFLCFTE